MTCHSPASVFYSAILIACLLTVGTSCDAQVLQEQNYDQLVPQGKEVDAIYGDYALVDQRVKAVVAGTVPKRNANMTVRNVAGCLIDLTHRQFESDQLSAFYPGGRGFRYSESIVAPGQHTVVAPGDLDRPECVVTYRLDPEHPVIHVSSRFKNTTRNDWQVVLQDEIRLDGQKEKLRRTKSPKNVSLYYINDVHWQQAYGFRATYYTISASSDQRLTKLTYKPRDGELPVLEPGETYTFDREILVHRHLAGVHAIENRLIGTPLVASNFVVHSGLDAPIPNAVVELFRDQRLHGVIKADQQGRVALELEPAEYSVNILVNGNLELKNQSLRVERKPNNFKLACTSYSPGKLDLQVVDQAGQSMPAKVEIQGTDATPTPSWGPDSADFFVRNLAYTPNGSVSVELDSGKYRLIVSRGPEYDAEFKTVTIDAGQTSNVRIALNHSVDSKGWISADFHSHSSPSGDNTGSQLGRVLNLAAEQIEFAPCTEHNRIDTYSDEISSLGLSPFLATETGMELTGQPLKLNHQNVFPMKMVPRTQDNGAPQTDADPEQQIERATLWDNRSEKLVQQNHPDIGWLFYDKDGDGEPDEGFSRSFRLMDVMEIHPIDPILQVGPFQLRQGKPTGNLPMFNWLQLLNQGHRIYGVVNTDAHYNYHGSGWLRNWIQSPTDQPNKIVPMDVVMAAQQGRLVMSNGPFLTAKFQAEGDDRTFVSGQSMNAKSGKVSVSIQVQCPNWFDVDRVFILVNGRKIPDYSFDRQNNPNLFADGVVQFDQTIEVEVETDCHLIVVTGNLQQKLGEVFGPSGGNQYPAALTNPVFVNVGEDDAFQPNKDTLGHPLPVKFGK